MQRPAFLGWSQCLKVQIEMGQSLQEDSELVILTDFPKSLAPAQA